MYNDIGLNVQTRYAAYKGRTTLLCSGDGETATRSDGEGGFKEIECPCGHKDPTYQAEHPKETKCKIATRFQCEIVGCEEVGGVFVFRSVSYNIAIELPSSLAYINTLTGGQLVGLELTLVVGPRTTDKGKIHVATVIHEGSRANLIETAVNLLESDALVNRRRELVEVRARKMLVESNELQEYLEDNAEEITSEHYPEETEKDEPDEIPALEEMPTIQDGVDTETGEIFKEEEKLAVPKKPTKAELTEAYFNEHLSELCMQKPFGGLKFADLKTKDKNWVHAQMIAISPPAEEQEPEQVEVANEEIAKTSSPADESSAVEKKKTKIKEPEENFISIPGTGPDNGWG